MKLSKLWIFQELLGTENEVDVSFDPRHEGVEVPSYLVDGPSLTLRYGRDLKPPVVGLHADERGIRAELMFGIERVPTKVPWSAIYRIAPRDKLGNVWVEDTPPEIKRAAISEPAVEEPVPAPEKTWN